MFLIDYFKSVLQDWGWLNKEARLLLLGLDNAGKTTLLHILKDNKLVQSKPTRNPTSEEMTIGNVDFKAFDLGGHLEARQLWRDYYGSVDAIVYIVDAADKTRYSENEYTIGKLLGEDILQYTPIVILGNKIDKGNALSEAELRHRFHLQQTSGKGTHTLPEHIRPIEVFMCSIANRQGYGAAFRWLAQYL